jgi:uncharacterized protein YciI
MLCLDKPDSLDLRLATREAHLAYAREQADVIRAGGPIVDGQGAMKGSMVLFDAPDISVAEGFARNDPYGLAGLFERVEIHAWRQTVGAPI